MKNPFPLLLLSAVAVGLGLVQAQAPVAAPADDARAYFEVLRSDFNSAKISTINEVTKLTGPEADAFWPVYRNYEKELAAVSDRKLALIRKFGDLHQGGALTDAAAKELAAEWLENAQDRLDLWKKHHKRISKAVSPLRAAQFLQIENQIALFVDMQIASEMPVITRP